MLGLTSPPADAFSGLMILALLGLGLVILFAVILLESLLLRRLGWGSQGRCLVDSLIMNIPSTVSGVLLGSLLLTACAANPGTPVETLEPRAGPTTDLPPATVSSGLASPVPELTATPGLVIRGSVYTTDEKPLAGVHVCRSFAAYKGERVATSDEAGAFRSDFQFIPGDELVHVWLYLDGYGFDPQTYDWRHYYSHEVRTLEFVAHPEPLEGVATRPFAPADCS